MPYIKQEDREDFEALHLVRPKNAGELNYCISTMLANYMLDTGMKYQNMNDVVGALEGAKTEFQRIVVNPYEDKKIAENGAVYDILLPPAYVIDIESHPGIAVHNVATGKTENYGYNHLGVFAPMDNGNPDETTQY